MDDARAFGGENEGVSDLVGQGAPPVPPRVEPRQLERVEDLNQLRFIGGLAVFRDQRLYQGGVVPQHPGELAQAPSPLSDGQGGPGRLGGAGPGDRVGRRPPRRRPARRQWSPPWRD